MNIYIVPMKTGNFTPGNVAIRLRKGQPPALFMKDIQLFLDGLHGEMSNMVLNESSISILGTIVEGMTLEDEDVLLVDSKNSTLEKSVKVSVVENNGIYLSEGVSFDAIGIATRMEKQLFAVIADIKNKNTISTGVQIFNNVGALYQKYPAFRDIMIKDENGEVKEVTLLELVTMQEEAFQKWAETMLLSMNDKYKTLFPVAKQILESTKTGAGFDLLSKEEQVAAFLEFSKRHADKTYEIVPDKVINFLKESPEYQASLGKLKEAGLGESPTQQFNVLQQVGYFGGRMTADKLNTPSKNRIIYNLSDMGAGKTLMTVQAIYVTDCLKLGVWNRTEKTDKVAISAVHLPDKHIIAPALSVKASWVDTFKLFYDVEKVDEYHYILTATFDKTKATSHLYIAPFTVRGGKIYVQEKLPDPGYEQYHGVYLIIDEIHQLVKRRISRTKFFPPKLVPADTYRTFALSGTMSNLKAGEWLSLIRFLGDTRILLPAKEAGLKADSLFAEYKRELGETAADIETRQHKKFNVDDVTKANRYVPAIKKKSAVDYEYFMEYGSKILIPNPNTADGRSMQDVLANKHYSIEVEPEESDNVSFELFYKIAASSAITAQSLQVAEELFGEQATQHKSSIIRTISPFTDEEIMLLDTLHKIAADSSKYRSDTIGREINNAILNLNDGLQQKDLYKLLSEYAERNTRFLKYLSTLDVNILERLPKTGLIKSPNVKETHKFHVLKELLEKDKDETFLIVVNDYYAMKTLSEALGVSCLTKQELKDEMSYQELLDGLFEKQSIVIVTQDMIKSSLDLVQANRLIQYQLNTEVSDIIQTQNRINRIGQTRETKCFYIAADRLQNALIELFLDSYRNIRVAHKGIVELFADLSSQIDVINDYLDVAFKKLGSEGGDAKEATPEEENATDLVKAVTLPRGYHVLEKDGICKAILYPEKEGISVIVPLKNGNPYRLGLLKADIVSPITAPVCAAWNLREMKLVV